MLVDSHCHLDFLDLSAYGGEVAGAIDAAAAAGVDTLLCISVDAGNVETVLSIAESHRSVYASVGTHPLNVTEHPIPSERLELLARRRKVVAIGETGLDYHYDSDARHLQHDSFERHLELAVAVCKPVVVHTREARADTLDLLGAFAPRGLTGVLHCFTEDWSMAKAALDMGFYISLSGIVTFRNAATLRDVARRVPADRLLIETDSPWLAPVPHRGCSNEPLYLPAVAQCVAEQRGIEPGEVAALTRENFCTLFGVDLDEEVEL